LSLHPLPEGSEREGQGTQHLSALPATIEDACYEQLAPKQGPGVDHKQKNIFDATASPSTLRQHWLKNNTLISDPKNADFGSNPLSSIYLRQANFATPFPLYIEGQ
jgi:hypothetical protein